MKKTLLALALGLLTFGVSAEELPWLTDMAKALDQAKAEKKTVLINFTGSDWCGFCIKLDKEVYQTSEFAGFAKKNLVLVKADFPRKVEQSAALKKANADLKTKYAQNFEGYPTIVLVDAAGMKLGQTVGYAPGSGPAAHIKELERLMKK